MKKLLFVLLLTVIFTGILKGQRYVEVNIFNPMDEFPDYSVWGTGINTNGKFEQDEYSIELNYLVNDIPKNIKYQITSNDGTNNSDVYLLFDENICKYKVSGSWGEHGTEMAYDTYIVVYKTAKTFRVDEPLVCVKNGEGYLQVVPEFAELPCTSNYVGDQEPFYVFRVTCEGVSKRLISSSELSYKDVQRAFGKEKDILNKELKVDIGFVTVDGDVFKESFSGVIFIPTPTFTISTTQPTCAESDDATITITGLPSFNLGEAKLRIDLIKYKDNGVDILDEIRKDYSTITNGTDIVINNTSIKEWLNSNGFELTAGNYEVKAFFDTGSGLSSLCPVSKKFTITPPDPIVITNIKVDKHVAQNGTGNSYHIKVHGGTTSGEITISGCNGGSLSSNLVGVSLSNPQKISGTTNTYKYTITGLKAGVNKIRITDNKGCKSNEYSITLTQAPELTGVTPTVNNIRCHGEKGSVDFTIVGGFGTYLVQLFKNSSSGESKLEYKSTTGSFLGLEAGNYTIKVTDKESKQLVQTKADAIKIEEPNQLILTPTKTNVSCKGESNGTISLSATGGTGSYAFKIGTEKISIKNSAEPKEYVCKVTDENGCFIEKSVVIKEPDPLSLSVPTIGNASCTTASNGSVSYSLSGGWNSDAVFITVTLSGKMSKVYYFTQRHFTISNLRHGNYNISVTNNKKCNPANASFTIGVLPLKEQFKIVSEVIKPASCNAIANGELKINVENGSGTYQLQLNGIDKGAYHPLNYITGLSAGKYNVELTDANGCIATKRDINVGIDAKTLKMSVSKVLPSCSSAGNGSMELQGVNGKKNVDTPTSKYFYSIDGTNYSNGKVFNNLTSKEHIAYVKDEVGCVVSSPVDLTSNAKPISFNLVSVPESCVTADNGKIEIKNLKYVDGLPLTYKLNGTEKLPINTSEYIGLNSGNYTIEISDANSCSTTKNITVANQNHSPSVSFKTTEELSCASASNGAIDVDVTTNYVSTLTYALFDQNNNKVNGSIADDTKFSGLNNQNYYFTATDQDNCSASLPVTVPINSNSVHFTNEEWISATCIAAKNGRIKVEASGGKPDTFGYTFSFNGEEKKGYSVEFTGLAVGTKGKVTVTDQAGCTSETAENTIQLSTTPLEITGVNKTHPICYNTNSGKIAPIIKNARENLIYRIEKRKQDGHFETVVPSPFNEASSAFENLAFGIYNISVEAEDACFSDYEGIELLNPEKAEVTESKYNYIKIKGERTGEYEFTLVGKNKLFSYELKQLIQGKPDKVIESGNLQYTNPNFELIKKFDKLESGSYVFALTDDNACLDFNGSETFTENFTIAEPDFELNFTNEVITHVSCNGLSDGAIEISGYGGWGEYSYSLNGGSWQKNGSYSNLAAGDYTIQIKDREETTISHSITITQPKVLSIAIDKTKNATCPGYNNGKLIATSTNGVYFDNGLHYWIENTDNRSVILGDSYSDNSYEFNQLPKGNYELFVSDSHSCTDSKTFSISEPKPVKIEYTNNYIKAKGDATGEISMAITDGNKYFDYKCFFNEETNAFAEGQTNENIKLSSLIAGSYNILVRDTAGCVYEDGEWMKRTIEIQEPDLALGVELIEKSDVTCYHLNDGFINLKAIGGWGEYQYSLNGNEWENTASYSNLKAGKYSIELKDREDIRCVYDFTITEPDTLNILIDKFKDATCPNAANGKLLATSINGIPFKDGLHYWIENTQNRLKILGDTYSGQTYQFNQLPKGNYEVFVSDSHHCVASKMFSISEPDTAKIQITNNYIKTKGDASGEILLQISKGNEFFNYEVFHNGTAFKSGDTNLQINLKNLLAGTYEIQVRDTAGCVYEDSEWMKRVVEMREPEKALSFELVKNTDVSCNSLSDGEIELKPIGGWGDYSYSMNGNEPVKTNLFANLQAATYHFQISDSVGTTWSQNIQVIEPEPLKAEYLSHGDVKCFNGNDGWIELKIEGGNSNYKHSLNETDWKDGTLVSGLKKGKYDVYIKDAKGCNTMLDNISINQPEELKLFDFEVTKSRCSNKEGSIVSQFKGGVGNYTYEWTKDTIINENHVWIPIPNNNSSNVNNLYSAIYLVKVTDEHNCELSVDFAVGDITDLSLDEIVVKDVSCWGYSDGQALAKVSKGNKPYTYNWDVDISQTESDSAWNISAGNYNLLIRDSKGCAQTGSFEIGTPAPLTYQVEEILQPLCYGGEKGKISLKGIGGTPAYAYQWSNGSSNKEIVNLDPGQYILKIRDSHNCESSFPFDMEYQRTLEPFIGNDTLICHYNTLVLDGGEYETYKWTSDVRFSSDDKEVEITDPGIYYLEVEDADQCLGFDTLQLDVSYYKIAELITKDVSCYALADGNAQVMTTPVGWVGGISWPDSGTETSWNNISGGTYKVEVEDEYGCVDSRDFTIYEPDTLDVEIKELIQPTCYDVQNGAIHIAALGGNGDYTYKWSNGNKTKYLNSLNQGDYSVEISDRKNCKITRHYHLKYKKTIQEDLGLDFLGTDTLICHYNTLQLDGKHFDKHYWTSDNGFKSRERYVELSKEGIYYLRIEDEDKCMAYDTIKLDVSYLQISDVKVKDVTCNSFANGSAQVEIKPENWEHEINWNDGSKIGKRENLNGGNYRIKVKDKYGCSDTRNFTIYEPDELAIKVENLFHPLCYGVPDGMIRLNALGGNGDYEFLWNTGSNKNKVSKLDQGQYLVQLTDKKGCQVTQNFDLDYQREIYPDLGEDLTICSDNFVVLYPGNYTEYQWMAGNVILKDTDSELVVWDSNKYVVEVKDELGCIASDTINVSLKESELNPVLLSASSVNAGDTLMVLEVGQPKPERIEWEFTGQHEITETGAFYCKLIYKEEGVFELGVKAYLNDCMAQKRESIMVLPATEKGDEDSNTDEYNLHIEKLKVYPNPAPEQFSATIKLSKTADLSLYLIHVESGQVFEKRSLKGLKEYQETFRGLQSGTYCICAESLGERQVKKVIVL
jgi:hypothetical protein